MPARTRHNRRITTTPKRGLGVLPFSSSIALEPEPEPMKPSSVTVVGGSVGLVTKNVDVVGVCDSVGRMTKNVDAVEHELDEVVDEVVEVVVTLVKVVVELVDEVKDVLELGEDVNVVDVLELGELDELELVVSVVVVGLVVVVGTGTAHTNRSSWQNGIFTVNSQGQSQLVVCTRTGTAGPRHFA